MKIDYLPKRTGFEQDKVRQGNEQNKINLV